MLTKSTHIKLERSSWDPTSGGGSSGYGSGYGSGFGSSGYGSSGNWDSGGKYWGGNSSGDYGSYNTSTYWPPTTGYTTTAGPGSTNYASSGYMNSTLGPQSTGYNTTGGYPSSIEYYNSTGYYDSTTFAPSQAPSSLGTQGSATYDTAGGSSSAASTARAGTYADMSGYTHPSTSNVASAAVFGPSYNSPLLPQKRQKPMAPRPLAPKSKRE
ncbi:hypothetical protein PG994_007135 [Apiospora phragmitis]|uniref:Uncharacterized protein n=1 Tax=Apiospora phragmitis TaxID=2905665 RepID=A0ABR1UZZ7_9PEZI